MTVFCNRLHNFLKKIYFKVQILNVFIYFFQIKYNPNVFVLFISSDFCVLL